MKTWPNVLNIIVQSWPSHSGCCHLVDPDPDAMTKKNKKQFRPISSLAPKIALNSKLVTWRNRENEVRHLFSNKIFQSMVHRQVTCFLASTHEELSEDQEGLDAFIIRATPSNSHKFHRPKGLCFTTGRGRSFQQRINMSRHTIRMLVRFGMLPGLIKERVN